jgi:hypothetical protein
MLVHTPRRYARAAARRAVRATETSRPTRVVVLFPGELAPDDLKRAEWVASARGMTVAMFQNGLAETVTPSRHVVTGMLWEMRLPSPRWGQRDRTWEQPPGQAWGLDRRGERRKTVLAGHWGLFDVAQSTVYASPPRVMCVKDAFDKHFRVDPYGRQVGLVAPAYSAVISYAMQQALGYRPTLRAVDAAMTVIRGRVWDGPRASFEAARAARRWAYTANPDSRLSQTEEDRSAQLIFERGRKRKRRSSKRTVDAKKHRMLDGAVANGRTGQPPRRSSRCRKRKADPAFFWNFKDSYVLALDEVSAPTMIHCLIADRMKRRRLAPLCKLV